MPAHRGGSRLAPTSFFGRNRPPDVPVSVPRGGIRGCVPPWIPHHFTMIARRENDLERWIARIMAVAFGVVVVIGGISVAADAGEILVAVPLVFVGSLAIAFGVTGRFTRSRRS